jgi:putative spermidine/putrescine transport system ATP-binding protein
VRAPRGSTAIALEGVAKTFPDGTRALLPTTLEVAPGEILALLGPSGCGKTTMLRLMAGLERPDAGGRIRFGEDDVTRIPIERREVGLVFQSYALFPNMTVAGNVGYGLKVKRVPRAEAAARVAEVLSLSQLSPLAGRNVKALSGGQRQRVALARAVAPRPRVLLLDEPLSALDAALRERLRTELATLLRELGTTAVFVTHDQSEAMAIADRIAVMSEGRILQTDAPETLYRRPANAFVAEFVGGANRLGATFDGARLLMRGGALALSAPVPDGHAVYARPETLRLSPPGEATLTGTVAAVIFQGTHHRLTLTGVTERPVVVDHVATLAPRIGERVGLALDPDDALVLPDASAPPGEIIG